MRSAFRRQLRRLPQAVLAAALTGSLGGCGGGGGGGGSSSGGGGAALGVVVIAVGAWLGKSLLERMNSDAGTPLVAEQMPVQFVPPGAIRTTGNVGYVALSRAPASHERNQTMCALLVRSVLDSTLVQPMTSNQLDVTVWPMALNHPGTVDKTNCTDLILHHDYQHSSSIFQQYELRQVQGPVLISFMRSSTQPSAATADRPTLVWDISPIAQTDFPLVIKAWALLQRLSAEEMKKALAEASFEDQVDRIAGIAASRAYAKTDIKLSMHEKRVIGQPVTTYP